MTVAWWTQPSISTLRSCSSEISVWLPSRSTTRTMGLSSAPSGQLTTIAAAAVGELDVGAGGERRDDAAERFDDDRIEQRATAFDDRPDAVAGGPCRRVQTLRRDRVVDIGDGRDPCHQVNFGARLAVGVARAVPAFVVA